MKLRQRGKFSLLAGLALLSQLAVGYRHVRDLKGYLQDQDDDFDDTKIMDRLLIGSLGLYHTPEELQDLMDSIMDSYEGEVVYEMSLGDSKEGRPLMAYVYMLGSSEETFEEDLEGRESIVLDAVHHARELTTISQVAYTMLALLHGYEHGKKEYIELMENAAVVFIPMVNPDGVNEISRQYKKTKQFEYIRKNRNVYDTQKYCYTAEFQGVDLNRNYGHQFGYDDEGSSGKPCAEDYRGPYAFSEPETQAMRDFLIAHPKVRVVLNFHAWGPLFITAYNWDDRKDNPELPEKAKMFYEEVFRRQGVPDGYIAGNGRQTIGYTANGEASDWMLHELGIYAMSTELGIQDRNSETFFIKEKETLLLLLKANFVWIENTMLLLFDHVTCVHTASQVTHSYEEYLIVQSDLSCYNRGLQNSPSSQLVVSKSRDLGTELINAFFAGFPIPLECEEVVETSIVQPCYISLPSFESQSFTDISIVSYLAKDDLTEEQLRQNSKENLFEIRYLESLLQQGGTVTDIYQFDWELLNVPARSVKIVDNLPTYPYPLFPEEETPPKNTTSSSTETSSSEPSSEASVTSTSEVAQPTESQILELKPLQEAENSPDSYSNQSEVHPVYATDTQELNSMSQTTAIVAGEKSQGQKDQELIEFGVIVSGVTLLVVFFCVLVFKGVQTFCKKVIKNKNLGAVMSQPCTDASDSESNSPVTHQIELTESHHQEETTQKDQSLRQKIEFSGKKDLDKESNSEKQQYTDSGRSKFEDEEGEEELYDDEGGDVSGYDEQDTIQ